MDEQLKFPKEKAMTINEAKNLDSLGFDINSDVFRELALNDATFRVAIDLLKINPSRVGFVITEICKDRNRLLNEVIELKRKSLILESFYINAVKIENPELTEGDHE